MIDVTSIEIVSTWPRVTADILSWGLSDLVQGLEPLISKLDEIDQHPSFKSLFVLAFTHGAEYDGPSWSDAYAKAREALERK